ncbi:hypothetical protein BFG60_3768 [Microcystis aeruginosa NIES-98]|nr:hypothetical protein BFG60_3768 [Microcystis aeruginosa NIES-98]
MAEIEGIFNRKTRNIIDLSIAHHQDRKCSGWVNNPSSE